MIELTTQEIMTLIQLCSKACLIKPTDVRVDNIMERTQFGAAQKQVVPILARLDNEYPGLMPVPHDGVEWKDRVASRDGSET